MNSPQPASPPSSSSVQPGAKSGQGEMHVVVNFFKTIIIFVAAAILLRGSVIEAFKIPSGSMLPTLKIGDHILVSKLSYGFRLPFMTKTLYQYSAPQRGDIVVFTRPDDPSSLENEEDINIIKRVIGLPGDTVEVRNRMVFINNEGLNEPYARWEEGGIPEGNFGPERIPDGHVLLLGDNRDHSRDSRFWPSPFLEMSRIKGRALVVYWSWDSLSRIGTVLH